MPATNGLTAPDHEAGLSISNPAITSSAAAGGAISQTIDSVAYNKEADQGNDTIVEPMTTAAAATDDAFGAAFEGVDSVGGGDAREEVTGGVAAGGFDVFTASDELRY